MFWRAGGVVYWRLPCLSESDAPMATQAPVYTVDDVWRLSQKPVHAAASFYLIDGELIVEALADESREDVVALLAAHIFLFADAANLGQVSTNASYRDQTLTPAVSFISQEATFEPYFMRSHLAVMPDLAVEIISPSQSLAQVRRKAETYLRHGSALVWLVDPAAKTAEVWQRGTEQREVIESDGELGGADILPGFRLPLRKIFP